MSKKDERMNITIYSDVTDLFDSIKDDGMHAETYTLGMLHDTVNELVNIHGRDADISVEIEGDDYYSSWSWIIATTRLETEGEQKIRLKKEQDAIKMEQKRKKKLLNDRKKLYLKLKKEFGGVENREKLATKLKESK